MDDDGTGRLPREPQEVTRLWERYHGRVLRFFRGKGFGEEESRDLRQETFLRALQYHRDDLENEQAWLFTIASSIWKNHLRRNQTGKRSAPEVRWDEVLDETADPRPDPGFANPSGGASPLGQVLTGERNRLLRAAAEELPPRMRHATLLYLQGYRNREIAVLMNVSPQTVKTQLFAARQRLKEALGEHFDPPEPDPPEPDSEPGPPGRDREGRGVEDRGPAGPGPDDETGGEG